MHPRWRRVLPSTKVGITLAVAFAVVLGVSAWAYARDKRAENTGIAAVVSPSPAMAAADSDADGLADWEEALWKTDVNTTDSDGDGTGDGDEVRVSRNPALAGPGDEIETPEFVSFAAALSPSATQDADLTTTDLFSRALLGQAIDINQMGGGVGVSSAADIFAQLGTGGASEAVISPKQFSSSEITTVDATQENLRSYGNFLGAVLRGTQTETTSELIVFGEFARTKNPAVLEKLNTVAKNYDALAAELINAAVPTTLAQAHLAFVNSLAGIAASLERMTVIATDPLAGVLALEPYKDYSSREASAFAVIKDTLLEVPFERDEPGYVIITHKAPQPQ